MEKTAIKEPGLLETVATPVPASITSAAAAMSLAEAIHNRRSVRSWQDRPIPRETIAQVLEAGRWAPSGNNVQPWQFIVVDDPAVLQALGTALGRVMAVLNRFAWLLQLPVSELRDPKGRRLLQNDAKRRGAAFFRNAPVLVLVAAPKTQTSQFECAMAVYGMLLSATDLGLGTGFIGTCSLLNMSRLAREVLCLEKGIKVMHGFALGHPRAVPKAPPRRTLDEIVRWV